MDCPTCGRTNADGKDFCDCGEYLRWDPPGVFAIPQSAALATTAAAPAHAHHRATDTHSRRSRCCSCCAPPFGEGSPFLALAVATSGLLQGFVRNQTKRADAYTLRVDGLPQSW